MEQQLVQAQKMEGLGTLAGGIAHDFNNILAIILGYTNRLETFRSKPQEVPGAIKVIKEAVDRGAALVQQLLTSARQTEAQLSSLDLNALVRELERMLQATFPKMINFNLESGARPSADHRRQKPDPSGPSESLCERARRHARWRDAYPRDYHHCRRGTDRDVQRRDRRQLRVRPRARYRHRHDPAGEVAYF